jgi:hypothetical protein
VFFSNAGSEEEKQANGSARRDTAGYGGGGPFAAQDPFEGKNAQAQGQMQRKRGDNSPLADPHKGIARQLKKAFKPSGAAQGRAQREKVQGKKQGERYPG